MWLCVRGGRGWGGLPLLLGGAACGFKCGVQVGRRVGGVDRVAVCVGGGGEGGRVCLCCLGVLRAGASVVCRWVVGLEALPVVCALTYVHT